MAKSVLGNDPFKRGAAIRSPADPGQLPVAESLSPAAPAGTAAPTLGAPLSKTGSKRTRPARRRTARSTSPAKKERRRDEVAEAKRLMLTAESEPTISPVSQPTEMPTSAAHQEQAAFEPSRRLSPADVIEQLKSTLNKALQSDVLKQIAAAADGAYQLILTGVGAGQETELDAYGKDVRLVELLEPWAKFFYERYWRVAVQGAENVPTGAVLIVANHSGALPYDGLVLKRSISVERPELEEARWLVEDQFFYAAFVGVLLNRLGAVRASPENAIRLLSERRPVLVFPEGVYGAGKPYAERYQVKRFGRGGFVKIALRQGVPIVPAALVGAEEALPMVAKLPGILGLPYLPLAPLGPIPLPSRWRIRFGQALDLSSYGSADANDPALVQRLTEQTRESIERMIQALLAERGSVFAG